MNKTELKIALFAFMLFGTVLTGCSSDNNQMEKAYEETPETIDDKTNTEDDTLDTEVTF